MSHRKDIQRTPEQTLRALKHAQTLTQKVRISENLDVAAAHEYLCTGGQ